jgi:GT2 family glycosyltransferase
LNTPTSEKPKPTLAALITCHNRRPKTLACLRALYESAKLANVSLTTVLVDDGSSDGTADAVLSEFPDVQLIRSDGTLFWNRGTYTAFAWALDKGFDYYLWLNDDTELFQDAVSRLLGTEESFRRRGLFPAIIVGNVKDPDTGLLNYGGCLRTTKWRPLHFSLVRDSADPSPCDALNGNCVLIPAAAAERLGNLDWRFEHSMGDRDYGLRAKTAGVGTWTAGAVVGTCPTNHGTVIDPSLSPWRRLKLIASRKMVPPGSWLILTRRHAGTLWPLYFAWPYVRAFFWRVS